ncbi:MAG: hypothetical protein AAGH83_02855 [Pseudomonadota bacterium]
MWYDTGAAPVVWRTMRVPGTLRAFVASRRSGLSDTARIERPDVFDEDGGSAEG